MKEKAVQILDYIIEYSLYILIFFIPIGKAPLQICATIAFVAFVAKKILKPEFYFFNSPAHLFLLSFVIFSGLSVFGSGLLFKKSLVAFLFKWMKYIGIFLFIEDTLVNRKRLRNAVVIFLFSSALVVADGIFQKFAGMDFIRNNVAVPLMQGGYGISASFNHYNDFGSYLIVILFLVIALSISGKLSKTYFTILLVLEALVSLCLIFTFSRGAWLGFSFGLFLMIVLSTKIMTRKVVLLLPVFIGVFILVPELRDRVVFTFMPTGDADRFKVWGVALGMIRDNPLFGNGIGLFMDHFAQRMPRLVVQYAHNCYLQIWAETGIFSLLSFLGFIILLLVKGIKVFKNNQDFVLLGFLCGFFALLVHTFFDTQLYSPQTAILFWSVAGIISVMTSREIKV